MISRHQSPLMRPRSVYASVVALACLAAFSTSIAVCFIPPAYCQQSSVKLYGQVNELLSACANAGIEITSTTLPARIKKVRMGSSAFYGGLQDNDIIVKGTLDNNRLSLTIHRGPATYAIDLATQAGAASPAVSLKSKADSVTLSAGTDKQVESKDPAWKKLKTYDIVMLIDQSGSMADTIDANGTSKWDWCSTQLTSFASQALENTGQRFTIVTFNGIYSLRSNCSPKDVQRTFLTNTPQGATDLATPLDFVLKGYIDGPQTKPLLVVVLTDGMPANPNQVEKSIVEISKRMSTPDQIKIVFFEIGNDAEGAAMLKLLDFELLSEGAKYDIVDANSFSRLQEIGLKMALYDTFNGSADSIQTSHKNLPSQSLNEELQAVRKKLQEARARSSQNNSSR